ncbi:signal peptidase II [Clostridiales bacterium COT073_COT-073]|nr:signal peptidase II [Clostridiales bacterium COT073_COT-073]
MKSIIWILILVIVDQLSKILTVLKLKGSAPISLIPGVFELTYVENTGVAFGIFANKEYGPILLSVFTGVVFLLILYFRYKLPLTKKYDTIRFVLSFLIAGALGNLIDRVRLGYVIDMLHFYWFEFPVFNIADSYVVVSSIVLVILVLTKYRDLEF